MVIATKIKPSFLIEIELSKAYEAPTIIAGIDEAGRGPLAGPVVAASVILDQNYYPANLNDSKKLTSKMRETICLELKNNSKFGIGIVDEKVIDKINIRNATKLAMQLAHQDLCQKYDIIPSMVIVDGNFVPDINCPAKFIIKGDQKSLSIAAASIIAKETRDVIMLELAKEFPQYNWEKNKGYPTASHFAAIKEFGITKYHRESFTLIK
ncbi:MAG: rnhB [Rickettsiaceae bacterium]|nr:rnhB [Rickettsiaceae bacterium]